jgi:hypothetical protein
MKQFEIIKARSQIEFSYLLESHYITSFISDLRKDIKHLVISQHFHKLSAYQYAKHMEIALDYQNKRNKPVYKSMTVSFQTNVKNHIPRDKPEENILVLSKEQSKNALIEHRRALGLYFKCAEKYYLGHQCKIKVYMLLGQEEEDEECKNLNCNND